MTEERIRNAITGGEKGKKPENYALIPVDPLMAVARIYDHGTKKYEDRNWEKGYDWSLSYSALQRHANKFWKGETYDYDPCLQHYDLYDQGELDGQRLYGWKKECNDCGSGEPHLASVVFHAFAMMEWQRTHPELDDRPTDKLRLAQAVWSENLFKGDATSCDHSFVYRSPDNWLDPTKICEVCGVENFD